MMMASDDRPGAGAVEPWLDDVVADELGHEEQSDDPQQHRPARIDRDREGDGEEGGQEGAEIGNEAQHRRQQPPQHRIRHADEVEGDADRDAVGQVHHQLHQQIAADPGGGIVEGLRALLEIACPSELDEAVAQVLPLEQHEDHEDDDKAGGGERREQRTDDGLDDLERLGLRGFEPDGDRLLRGAAAELDPGVCGRRVLRDFSLARDLLAEILDGGGDLLDDAAAGRGVLQGADLLGDGGLVGREVVGELNELAADHEGDACDQDEGEGDGNEYRSNPRQPEAPEPVDQRREREAQEDRQGEGDENIPAEVEASDRQDDAAGGQDGGIRGL